MADDIDDEDNASQKSQPDSDSIQSEPLLYEDDSTDEHENNEHSKEQELHLKREIEPCEEVQFKQKIILGTKPCPKTQDCDVEDMPIDQEDWGEHFRSRKCFCNDCETLFATREALEAHNQSAHSPSAIDAPKLDKPEEKVSSSLPAKEIVVKNLDPKNPNSVEPIFKEPTAEPKPTSCQNFTDNPRFCKHCQVLFNDDNLLIQHLQELLTAKHAKKNETNETNVKCVASTSTLAAPFVYTCPTCSMRFNEMSHMQLHIDQQHPDYLQAKPHMQVEIDQQRPDSLNEKPHMQVEIDQQHPDYLKEKPHMQVEIDQQRPDCLKEKPHMQVEIDQQCPDYLEEQPHMQVEIEQHHPDYLNEKPHMQVEIDQQRPDCSKEKPHMQVEIDQQRPDYLQEQPYIQVHVDQQRPDSLKEKPHMQVEIDQQSPDYLEEQPHMQVHVDQQPPEYLTEKPHMQVEIDQQRPDSLKEKPHMQLEIDQQHPDYLKEKPLMHLEIDQQRPDYLEEQPHMQVHVDQQHPDYLKEQPHMQVHVDQQRPDYLEEQPHMQVHVDQQRPDYLEEQPHMQVHVDQQRPDYLEEQPHMQVHVDQQHPDYLEEQPHMQVHVDQQHPDYLEEQPHMQVHIDQLHPDYFKEKPHMQVHIDQLHPDYFKEKPLYALTVKSNIKKQLLRQSKNMKSPKFRCGICKCTFVNSESAKFHHSNSHPGKKKIIKLIGPKALASTFRKLSKDLNIRNLENSGLLQTQALFQCRKCQVQLMSCITALAHSASCREETAFNNFKCEHCNKIFRVDDRKLHELQHRHTDKFKVFVTHTNIYSRILYKCPKCEVCFQERMFLRHVEVGCHNNKTVEYCSICKLNINDMPIHNQMHVGKCFVKSDFILIDEFFSMTTKSFSVENKTVERKRQNLEEPETPSSAKIQKVMTTEEEETIESAEIQNDIPPKKKTLFYYCQACRTYIKYKTRRKFHLTKKCKQLQNKLNKQHCPVCGLLFYAVSTLQDHLNWHLEYKVELKDFDFASVDNLKRIVPPMPEFPTCNICHVQYLSPSVRFHGCKRERNRCDICKKVFNDLGYKIHMLYHKYIHKDMGGDEDFASGFIEKFTFKSNQMRRLDGEYNQKLKLGNRISAPQMLCEPKDRAIKNKGGRKYTYYECQHCKTCVTLLRNLNTHVCLDKKLHRVCSKCNLSFTFRSIYKHMQSHATRRDLTKANIILIPFNEDEIKENNNYEKVQSDDESVTDVDAASNDDSFNNKLNKENNQKLESTNRISETLTPQVLSVSKNKVAMATMGRKYKYYECQNCKTCVSLASNLNTHICIDKKFQRVCSECKLTFSFRSLHKHLQSHARRNDLTKANINLIPFNEDKIVLKRFDEVQTDDESVTNIDDEESSSDNAEISDEAVFGDEKSFSVYKCSCGLHFTSLKIIKQHYTECSPDNEEIPSTECKWCKLIFPTELLANHLCNHHTGRYRDYTVVYTCICYKCDNCQCLFRNLRSVRYHLRVCNLETPNGVKCAKCGLVFHAGDIRKHQFWDHSVHSAYRGNFICRIMKVPDGLPTTPRNSIQVQSIKNKLIRKKTYKYKVESQTTNNIIRLFKCRICGRHFSQTEYLTRHLRVGQHNTDCLSNCPKCGLLFASSYISQHITLHHQYGSNTRDDFDIIEKGLDESSVSMNLEVDKTTITDSLRTVPGNDTLDDENNPKLVSKNRIPETLNPQSFNASEDRIAIKEKGRKYKYYQCQNCRTCVKLLCNLNTHICINKKLHRVCPKCKLTFTFRTIYNHLQSHKIRHDLTRANIILIPFNDDKIEVNKNDEAVQSDDESDSNEDKTINSDSFNTLPVNGEVDNENYQILESENHAFEILTSKGLNATEDKVALMAKGKKYKYYECQSCKTCVTLNNTHICIDKKLQRVCPQCNLTFSFRSLHKHLQSHLRRKDLKRANIILVPFNKDKIVINKTINNKFDDENNKKLESKNRISKILTQPLDLSTSKYRVSMKTEGKKYKFYECQNCKTCITLLSRLYSHYCVDKKSQRVCSECNLIFTYRSIYRHLQSHGSRKDLTRANITLIPFNENTIDEVVLSDDRSVKQTGEEKDTMDDGEQTNEALTGNTDMFTVYRCSCKLHFTSRKVIKQHFTECIPGKEWSAAGCRWCKLIFPVELLPDHFKNHHMTANYRHHYVVQAVVRYKCENCQCLILKSRSILPHLRFCKLSRFSRHNGVKCDTCGLYFLETEIQEHEINDHDDEHLNLRERLYRIINISKHRSPRKTKQIKKKAYKYKVTPQTVNSKILLYKCGICSCHFSGPEYLSKHLKNGTHNSHYLTKCSKCGLLFSRNYMSQHINLHHQHGSGTRECFEIIEKGLNKSSTSNNLEESVISSTQDTNVEAVNILNTLDSNHSTISTQQHRYKLYKCFPCNVHFMNQNIYLKHIVKHIPIHPKESIECKHCGLQFRIATFKLHLRKHHSNVFNLNEVLIDEYPTTDISGAINKVQSPFVNTTTADMDVNSTQAIEEAVSSVDDEVPKSGDNTIDNLSEKLPCPSQSESNQRGIIKVINDVVGIPSELKMDFKQDVSNYSMKTDTNPSSSIEFVEQNVINYVDNDIISIKDEIACSFKDKMKVKKENASVLYPSKSKIKFEPDDFISLLKIEPRPTSSTNQQTQQQIIKCEESDVIFIQDTNIVENIEIACSSEDNSNVRNSNALIHPSAVTKVKSEPGLTINLTNALNVIDLEEVGIVESNDNEVIMISDDECVVIAD